jgi:hypothetical protein
MPSPQIPSQQQPISDSDGITTTSWFTFLQSIYKAIRANLPTKLSGILNIDVTPVGNIGGGTDDLISYSLPANIMKNDGDYLEVEGWGILAANGNNKTITVNFGSQTIYTTAANAANAGTWSFKAKIIRLTSSTQEIVVEFLSNNTDLQNDTDYPAFRTAGTQDLTSALIIKCTGAATSNNDIVQKAQIIKLSPND